jgi:hypothetical protein
VRAATSQLRAKYLDANGTYRLAPEVVNQFEACFDFELASSLASEKQWLLMLFHLGRSFWRVPRGSLHLRRLWTHPASSASGRVEAVPAGVERGKSA